MNALTRDIAKQAASAPDLEFGADLLRIFRRRKLVILATMLVITAAAAAFAALWPPMYKATSTLVVATNSIESRTGTDIPLTAAQDESLINNQVQMLANRALAKQVVTDLGLFDDREFNPVAGQARPLTVGQRQAMIESATDALRKNVTVRRVGRTSVILISAAARSPAKAARIANKFGSAHIRLQLAEKAQSTVSAAALLEPQVAALRQQVIDADKAVADYARKHNIVGASDTPDTVQIGQVYGALADARSSRYEASARSGSATAAGVDGPRMPAGASSPLLNDLRRQNAELGKKIAELSVLYGAGYPELANARAQLDDVNTRLAAETARLGRELQAEVAITSSREGRIRGDLESLRSQSFAQRSASVQLMDLQRTADANRQLYAARLTRLKQLSGEAGMAQVPIKFLARAMTPEEPAFPRPKEIVGVALIGSFFLGLVLAYAFELLLETRVQTAAQINRLLGVPTLGMVPDLGTSATPAHRLLVEQPSSVYAESVRSLYLDLLQRLPVGRSSVVLITSPLPGEGKTTVALSLGAAAAVLWRKTVVVDLDLRRPALFDAAGMTHEHDLASFLDGKAEFADILAADPDVKNLSIIGVGHAVRDPASMLASPKMKQLMDKLRSNFDMVVINAPPILAVTDAKVLSRMANATLMVVRWGKSRNEAVSAAARVFGAPITGAVINRVDYRRHASAAFGDAVQHHYECSDYHGQPA